MQRFTSIFLRLIAALACSLALLSCVTGCAHTDDSDIPWNAPQPWEGAPTLPGLNQ